MRAGAPWAVGWAFAAAAACAIAAPAGAAGDAEQIDIRIVDESWRVPDDFTVRVRVNRITPPEPTAIHWRRKGEGLGGNVIRGAFSERKLPLGRWSPAVKVNSLGVKGGFPAKMFLTVTAGRAGRTRREPDGRRVKTDYSTGAEFEFEFRFGGEVVKRLKEAGPDGGTVGIVIPAYRLAGGKTPEGPAFLDELTGILEYATRRADRLEKLPWSRWPRPRRYAVINNIGGYGYGIGYGVRMTNKAVVAAECRALRTLGVNGFRSPKPFLLEMIRTGEGFAKDFRRGCIAPVMGYPVPSWRAGRKNDPECGCPYAPGLAGRTKTGIEESLKVLRLPVEEVWGLTVDEIGTVIDRSAEGKGHLSVCPRCADGFREYLRSRHLKPADFGRTNWAEVSPARIWQPRQIGPKRSSGPEPPTTPAAFKATERPVPKAPAPADRGAPDLTDPHSALLAYWTLRFNNHLSAKLFTPLRDAFAAANDAKRKALTAGKADSPAARQPFVYSYALRGNTFLMKGHSLDFFNFYRLADNGFVYETSNREPRIWSWDSYLCDVGRVVSAKMDKRFGIYVKPHRGAPLQRALSAVSRGATMIYWYTYGPDYHKGDSFSQSWPALELTCKAAGLIGKTEDVLYGSRWAQPAQVAVVKPRSSEIWMRLVGGPARQAAWENAKWTYTALAHAHVPVDPLDEGLLATENLSRYKVIYVSGPNLTRAAARKLARWVADGGVLYTSGWGLARDEANRPLAELAPVLGLTKRSDPRMYYQVSLYGASRIESYSDRRKVVAPVPEGAALLPGGMIKRGFAPVIGREVLRPGPTATVLAKFADGGAAITCNAFGRGKAYVVGLFPGLEYSAAVRHDRFDMSRDFSPELRALVAGPVLESVRPVVDCSLSTVEAVLLVNPASGKRAVTLMNWAYRVTGLRKRGGRVSTVTQLVPAEGVELTVRGAGKVSKITSAMLDKPLEFTLDGKRLTIRLPRLDEGDVLLLE